MDKITTLRAWRTANGMTQADVAQKLGMHVQSVSAIECGRKRPSMAAALRIRDMTDGAVSLDSLVQPFDAATAA
jgi:transcriptional regulator with XRE-family HTH domain